MKQIVNTTFQGVLLKPLFVDVVYQLEKGNKIRVANQLIRLNHYVCQSEEFFQKVKSIRGDATQAKHKWTRALFNAHNEPATFLDETLKNIVLNTPENY